MTSANLTVALPTAEDTVGAKTECRLSEDKMKDLEGNSSVAGYVLSSTWPSWRTWEHKILQASFSVQSIRLLQFRIRHHPSCYWPYLASGNWHKIVLNDSIILLILLFQCRCKTHSTRFRNWRYFSYLRIPLLPVSPTTWKTGLNESLRHIFSLCKIKGRSYKCFTLSTLCFQPSVVPVIRLIRVIGSNSTVR